MGDAGADDATMRRAIQLSEKAMVEGTGPPFGAVIVRDGRILAEGFNNSTSTNDSTAHAEIVAIRLACTSIGHHRLDGCIIYSSSEPCPMCLSAIYWSGIEKIYYVNDVAAAAEAGFDDSRLYRELATPAQDCAIPASQLLATEGKAVFDARRARRKGSASAP
jgi:tRNA(Arg) A34 adenosine deaminase TadA